jgi:hypothetical protein
MAASETLPPRGNQQGQELPLANSLERAAVEPITVHAMVERLESAKNVTIQWLHLIGQTGRNGVQLDVQLFRGYPGRNRPVQPVAIQQSLKRTIVLIAR